ncbi:flavin reductase family protein [Oenococcus oeni]|uniref:flavin reductase family protein n=1 Tax=Oenococcus oeni TaxID=1247 RepID=UPI0029537C48|nr:flavin reductase [Oenococcus oeni]
MHCKRRKISHQQIKLNSLYYGFPVALISSWNQTEKSTNITPISSVWSLNDQVVIGLGTNSQAFQNLFETREAILNIPDKSLWRQIEKISNTTGKEKVPNYKKEKGYSYCPNKFQLGSFTKEAAKYVRPDKIKECPIQIELKIEKINSRKDFAIIEAKILASFVERKILKTNQKIDNQKWHPLLYKFREYRSDDLSLGFNFRYQED